MMMKSKISLLLICSIVIALSGQVSATPVFQSGHILLDTSGDKVAWASGGTGHTGGWADISYSGDNWYVQWFENDGATEIETSVTFLEYKGINPSADAVIYYSNSGYSGSNPPANEADIVQDDIMSWGGTSSEIVSDTVTNLAYAPEWVGIGIKGSDVQAYEMTSAIPEPATVALLGFGGFALLAKNRKKRR